MTEVLDSPEDIKTLFADLGQRVKVADYTEELEGFLPRIAEFEAGMFAGQFDSNLEDWSPLRPATIRRKGDDRILIDAGALRDSLIHVGGPGNIAESAPRGLLFGTNIEYAGFLQEGTSKMPARPPVGMSEEMLDKLCEVVADATVEKMKS